MKLQKSDQSVTNSYLKEINILKQELNKKETLIKGLVEIKKNLTKNSLKHNQYSYRVLHLTPTKIIISQLLVPLITNKLT